MRTLPPQILKDADFQDVEDQLLGIFSTLVFDPIIALLRAARPQDRTLKNAPQDSVLAALHSGRIQYEAGVFSGSFTAAIGRLLLDLGATFDKRRAVYRLDPKKIPPSFSAAAAAYRVRAQALHDEIVKKLNEMETHIERSVEQRPVDPKKTLTRIEDAWKLSARDLEVKPELTEQGRANLVRDYSENMKLWIRKFSTQMIQDLRQTVTDNAEKGYRFDSLIAGIRNRYGVTESKAKFLARQETALFMSNYRKQRFSEAGLTQYRWSTSRDQRVRDDHKHLDGRIFSYDNPPIVDRATGRRANPGADFNCRCVDIPILSKGPAEAIAG